MNKKSFLFDFKQSTEKIMWNDDFVEVETYLTNAEIISLIDDYVKNYFHQDGEFLFVTDAKHDVIGAENYIIPTLLLLKTNIEIDDTFNLDGFISSGLWGKITGVIKNYDRFRQMLELVVSDIKEQKVLEKSLGTVLENIFSGVFVLIDNLSEKVEGLDIEEVKKTGQQLLKEIEKSPVADIFKESSGVPIVSKRKKVSSDKVH